MKMHRQNQYKYSNPKYKSVAEVRDVMPRFHYLCFLERRNVQRIATAKGLTMRSQQRASRRAILRCQCRFAQFATTTSSRGLKIQSGTCDRIATWLLIQLAEHRRALHRVRSVAFELAQIEELLFFGGLYLLSVHHRHKSVAVLNVSRLSRASPDAFTSL